MNYLSESEIEDYSPRVGRSQRKSAAGRELIRWDPEKDQLALLCTDYVCTTEGVAVPWDKIAEVMGSLVGKRSMTGEAIKQHLAKLHKFRDEANQLVPPKLDRHQRRKPISATKTEGTSAASRSRRRARNDDDDEDMVPATPVKPGKSLLFTKPGAKPKRAPRTQATGRSNGRKGADVDEFQDNGGDLYDRETPPKRRATTGQFGDSKRGRKPQNNTRVDEDEQDAAFPTPSRTPKRLRPQPEVNYAELPFEDDEGQDAEHNIKQEQYHSLPDYHQAPGQHAGNKNPINGYSRTLQDGYIYGAHDNTSPYQSSPCDGNMPGTSHGLPYDLRAPYQLQTPRSIATPSDYGNNNSTFPQFGQGQLDHYPAFSFANMPQFSRESLGHAAENMLNNQEANEPHDFARELAAPEPNRSTQHDLIDTPAQYDHPQTYLPAYGGDAVASADHFLGAHTPIDNFSNVAEHPADSIEHIGLAHNPSFDSGIYNADGGDLKGFLDEPFGHILNDQTRFT